MILLLKFNSHFSARLREHLARPVDQGLDANTKKRLNLQVFIASLLCEHCDFDKLRVENAGMGSDIEFVCVLAHVSHWQHLPWNWILSHRCAFRLALRH